MISEISRYLGLLGHCASYKRWVYRPGIEVLIDTPIVKIYFGGEVVVIKNCIEPSNREIIHAISRSVSWLPDKLVALSQARIIAQELTSALEEVEFLLRSQVTLAGEIASALEVVLGEEEEEEYEYDDG